MKIFILSMMMIFTGPRDGRAQVFLKELALDTSIVITALEENSRYTWIGTNKGLYRVNNRNGKYWHLTCKKSTLPGNYVTSIACFPGGQTYIGTKNGILFWDNSVFIPITMENSDLPENYITLLSPDSSGNLLIGTRTCGLLKGIGKCVKVFKLIKASPKDYYTIKGKQPMAGL